MPNLTISYESQSDISMNDVRQILTTSLGNLGFTGVDVGDIE